MDEMIEMIERSIYLQYSIVIFKVIINQRLYASKVCTNKLIYRILTYNLINYLFNYLFMEFYWKNKTFVCDLKSMNKD